jgi:Flp pilus assembly protein TadG
MLKDEKGAMVLWIPILLIAVLISTVWVVETGRMMITRVDIQTAADAASLAGVATAEQEYIKEYDFITEGEEITEIIEKATPTGHIIISRELADKEAELLLNPNVPEQTVSDWESTVEDDEYEVSIQGVRFISVIEDWFGDIYLSATSRAKAGFNN